MARQVVPLRLSDQEREAIETAAKKRRLTLSEFLRQAALMIAYRLGEQPKQEKQAPKPPTPPRRAGERHITNTYKSFHEYRSSSPFASSPQQLPSGGTPRNPDE